MTALEKIRIEEDLRLRNDLRTRDREFGKRYGRPSDKKMTAAEFIKAARAAGHDSLSIFADQEQEGLIDLQGQVVPTTIPQPALGVATTIPGCNCQECRRQHITTKVEE